MRRPEKVGGVIRPRTLGLGKAASAPEPLPPPPPPSAGLLQNKRIVYGAIGTFLCLCLLFLFRGREDPGLSTSDKRPDVNLLRADSTAFATPDDDDDGEKHESGNILQVKSNKAQDNFEEDPEPDEDEDSENNNEDSANGDDEKTLDDKPVDDDETDGNPVTSDEHNSRPSDSGRDRSKTVESYFVNFGGRVVDIDREGSYKYVLVKMEDIFGSQALLVRGCPHKEGTHCKHGDAFARAKAELELRGFKATVLGGGRITRHPSRHQKGQKEGYISVFGYSKTFGACEDCNKIACSLIKATLPDHGIKWANEGYLESDERKVRDDAWTKC